MGKINKIEFHLACMARFINYYTYEKDDELLRTLLKRISLRIASRAAKRTIVGSGEESERTRKSNPCWYMHHRTGNVVEFIDCVSSESVVMDGRRRR